MKPKTAKLLSGDVVEYTPPVPRGSVQALALARAAAPATPAVTFYTPEQVGDFAVEYLQRHSTASAQEMTRALYGTVTPGLLRQVGNSLSRRKQVVGDVAHHKVNSHQRGAPRGVWTLADPNRANRHNVTLLTLERRLVLIEAGLDRVLKRLQAIFKAGEWPE